MTGIDVDDVGKFTDRLREAGERFRDRGSVTVPLLPLRQALLAVKPHAAGPKDHPDLQTVRILPGATHTWVVATDRNTMALASVRTSDLDMEELDPIDLHTDDATKILAVFKMPADKELWPDCVARLEPRGHDVSVTDAGGLFDGQELVVPAHPREFPDVPAILAKHVATARALGYPPSEDRGLPGTTVAKLAVAVKTFDEPAYIQPVSADPKAVHLMLVGPRFIAAATPATPADVDDEGPDADWTPTRWRQAWSHALPRRDS